MGRYEFLKKLKEALENDLDHQKVQEHVNYYTQYINEELQKGRTEEEIIEELGDPWMISRTIVGSPGQEEDYGQSQTNSYDGYQDQKSVSFGTEQPAWKKWLIMIAAVLILFVVLSAVIGIFRRLLPFLIPVIVVIMIIKMFKK